MRDGDSDKKDGLILNPNYDSWEDWAKGHTKGMKAYWAKRRKEKAAKERKSLKAWSEARKLERCKTKKMAILIKKTV